MFIPQTDSPPWIVLFCNHPSSACRRDMEPRSQGQRGLGRFLVRWKQRVRAVPYRDPSWPTAVVFHPPRFPWNFRDFLKTFHQHLGKIGRFVFGRDEIWPDPITEEDVSGCTITLAKIWGVPLPFSVSVSDRIIKNPDPWTMADHFEDPQTPLRFIQVQSPETIGGFWIFLVQVLFVYTNWSDLLRFWSTWSLQQKKVSAWRIIPASKWLITLVNVSPLTGVVPLPHGR